MDGVAWWAAVHAVAKSRTQLRDFTFTFHFHALEKEMATYSSVLAWSLESPRDGGASWAAIYGVSQSQTQLKRLSSNSNSSIRYIGFPGGSVVKNPPANAGDAGLIPGSGRSPGELNGNPLQYSCLGNPIDRGAWQATDHRVAKSQTQLGD